MNEKKKNEIFCINIENPESGNEKMKKFIEVTQEGKEKIKNYVSGIDKASCCKKSCFFLVKFILIVGLLGAIIFFIMHMILDSELLNRSIKSVGWDVENLDIKMSGDRRIITGKLDQIMNRLSSLESKMEKMNSNFGSEEMNPSFMTTDDDFFGIFWKLFQDDEDEKKLDGSKLTFFENGEN